jgi:uncharacterized protein YukE
VGEIRVVPSSLDEAAARLAEAGEQLAAIAGQLGAASGAGGAAGDGAAAASYSRMLSTWRHETAAIGGRVSSVALGMRFAAGAYQTTDQGAMPAEGPG